MLTVLSYPGNMAHAQNAALALFEADALSAFVTTFAYRRNGTIDQLLGKLPGEAPKSLARQLARRAILEVPPQIVHTHPGWEPIRTLAQKAGANPAIVDAIWDLSSQAFDRIVAQRYVPFTQAVQCFEYTALASFEAAQKFGTAGILHLPALDNTQFNAVMQREKEQWPELRTPYDAIFAAKFARRQERRSREIALADVIIANSSLTARSHIAGGASPDKTFVVPLAAPPTIEAVTGDDERTRGPLRVLYAGPFSLRKGAHYLLAAWKLLHAGTAASLDVYGSLELPERLIASGTDGIVFHGSVPRSELFKAFEGADVLVFPTLSDGFGMVVAEALAHGCPVITTDQAGSADLVTPDNGLIVPVANPQALADAMQWCLDNRVRLAEMRPHALKTAKLRQWSHFRRDLISALDTGLRRRGYRPKFKGVETVDAS